MGLFKKKDIPPPPPPGMELPPMPEDEMLEDASIDNNLDYNLNPDYDNSYDNSDLDLPPLPDEMPELPPLENNFSMPNMRNMSKRPLPEMPVPPKPMEEVYGNLNEDVNKKDPSMMPPLPKFQDAQDEDIDEYTDEDLDEKEYKPEDKYGIPQMLPESESESYESLNPTYDDSFEPSPMPTKPIFVNMKDFQYVINSAHNIKDKVEEVEEIILKLNEIKNVEEKAFDKWRRHLEDLEKKMSYIDSLIAKAEG